MASDMAMSPTIAEATAPQMYALDEQESRAVPQLPSLSASSFKFSTKPPAMAGMDMRNENSAAFSAFTPLTRPAAMEDPLREMPGRMASAWPIPIHSELLTPMLAVLFFTILGTNNNAAVSNNSPLTKTGRSYAALK